MSVTIDQLAAELNIDPQAIADAARRLVASSEDKVLTVGPSPNDPTVSITCLTDQAAAAIRAELSTV